jgi:protein MAK16
MASDDIVWSIINKQHCSFKLTLPTKTQQFCRNEFNVTGFCSRQACPLANSRYATIRVDPANGRLYLYMRTIERAHLPNKWWERIRLPANYAAALALVDDRLTYWPKWLIHKCKQRLTRLTQVAIRTRRLAREEERLGERLVPKLAPKIRRREATRERKAEAAAKVERAIERELIERLRSGAYGDKPINVEEGIWKKVLRGMEKAGEVEADEEEVEEEWEMEEGVGNVEYVSDMESDEDEDEDEEMEDAPKTKDDDEGSDAGSEEETDKLKKALQNLKKKRAEKPKKKPTKGPRREIEYEMEHVPQQMESIKSL